MTLTQNRKKCKNGHHAVLDTQIPQDEHRLLLAREIYIINGWIYCKDAQWNPRRHQGDISNTCLTPPFWYCGRCDQTIPNRRRTFFSFLAQILYLSNQARLEINFTVSFFWTIQGIISLPLILSIDKSGNIKWYVDAEFAVHKDMRSHTGGFILMGTGGSYIQSSP